MLAWVKAHRRTSIAGGVVLGVLLLYMLVGGALAARMIAGRATEKLGRPVTIGSGHGGFGAIVLNDVVVAGAPGQPPLVTVKEVRIPLGVVFGMRGPVGVDGLSVAAVNGGPADNVSAIADRLRGRKSARRTAPAIRPKARRVAARRRASRMSSSPMARSRRATTTSTSSSRSRRSTPSCGRATKLAARLRGVHAVVTLGAEGQGPSFGADEIDMQTPARRAAPLRRSVRCA